MALLFPSIQTVRRITTNGPWPLYTNFVCLTSGGVFKHDLFGGEKMKGLLIHLTYDTENMHQLCVIISASKLAR